MLEILVSWLLRLLLLALGAWALVWSLRWVRKLRRERRERWAVRIALGMLALAVVYAGGHAWLLLMRERIEEGRMRYARFGDPRLAELRRAEVRGWILDCTGEDPNALARYTEREGSVERGFPLGEAGANLVGGGEAAGERDFTVERLFASRLREPRSLRERGELHPAGRDLRLALCSAPTREAWRLLRGSGRPGAVVVQEVETGALVAYAATGGPEDPPLAIRRYAPPGSVFKLALSALWWESGMGDRPMGCPSSIQVAPGATISNFGGAHLGVVEVPTGMLVPSCNTAAVQMAMEMRERLGSDAFVEAYRRYGFEPYAEEPPDGTERDFWRTTSDAWTRRMSPAPSRIRISEETGPAEWAQLAIGQGPVDVTVVQISRFLQAIGNGGVMLPPTLEWALAEDPPSGERVMSEETARRLQEAVREIVRRGTGRAAAPPLQGTGWSIGGKTGTAQLSGAPDDGWFAALLFDPEGRPRYTVVVYLQGGGPGGGRPAAIAGELGRTLAQRSVPEEG